MDLNSIASVVAGAIRGAQVGVVAVGSGTHHEVGNPVEQGCDTVAIPSGIVAYDPSDMTITALAGTRVCELDAVLADHQQEVPLDPRDHNATIGGVYSCGLSGIRRLRLGPIRDSLLEVRFVDGRGTLVKGGGPVVKNVTGYDLPRLMVGSLGTLGVMVQLTLRCRPAPTKSAWFRVAGDPFDLRSLLYRPSAILWDGTTTSVLLEGNPDDIADEACRAGLGTAQPEQPQLPAGAHIGRISIEPRGVKELVHTLRGIDRLRCLAEVGVGTIHVAADEGELLAQARTAACAAGGWLLRERGGPVGFGGFGGTIANHELSERIRGAFDPDGCLAPGRMVDR